MSAPRVMLSGAEAAAIERGELDLTQALAARGIQRGRPSFTAAAGPEFAPVRLHTVTLPPGSAFGRALEARPRPTPRPRTAALGWWGALCLFCGVWWTGMGTLAVLAARALGVWR